VTNKVSESFNTEELQVKSLINEKLDSNQLSKGEKNDCKKATACKDELADKPRLKTELIDSSKI
jgi:hypothetical protein